jgi:hypothetical protein
LPISTGFAPAATAAYAGADVFNNYGLVLYTLVALVALVDVAQVYRVVTAGGVA